MQPYIDQLNSKDKEATYIKYTPEQTLESLNHCLVKPLIQVINYLNSFFYVFNTISENSLKELLSEDDQLSCIIDIRAQNIVKKIVDKQKRDYVSSEKLTAELIKLYVLSIFLLNYQSIYKNYQAYFATDNKNPVLNIFKDKKIDNKELLNKLTRCLDEFQTNDLTLTLLEDSFQNKIIKFLPCEFYTTPPAPNLP